jgi:hypothetical protein
MNYSQLLKNIMSQGHISNFRAAKDIQITIFTLQSFLNGIPVKASAETKLITWIEART